MSFKNKRDVVYDNVTVTENLIARNISGPNGSFINTKTIRISTAEILTLYSVGTQLIEAPGAGKSIMVLSAVLRYNCDGIQFTNLGNYFIIKLGSEPQGDGIGISNEYTISDDDALASGHSLILLLTTPSSTAFVQDSNSIENLPLYLGRTISDLTNTGNSTSTFDITINYIIV